MNFKDYWNKLFFSKKQLTLFIISIALILVNSSTTYEVEILDFDFEKTIDNPINFNFGKNELDEAYEWFIDNIELTSNDNVDMKVEKGNDNNIIINYIYNEGTTNLIDSTGTLPESELIALAEELTPLIIELNNYMDQAGYENIEIEMKVKDYEGHLYLYLVEDELIEMNLKVAPTNDDNNVKQEEKKESKKQELQGKCCVCGTSVADTSPSAYCDACAKEKDELWEEEHMNNCQNCGEMFLKWELQAYGEFGRLCPSCYDTMKNDPMADYGGKHQESWDPSDEHIYYCEYCGKQATEDNYVKWDGCCCELCAVNREGDAYEQYLKDTGQWED